MESLTTVSRVMYWVLFSLGILCILNFLFLLSLGIVMNVGVLFPVSLGIFILILSYMRLFKNVRIIRNVVAARTLKVAAFLFLLSFVIVEALIWTATENEKDKKVDYVILLGAGLKGDQITATFMNRMENCAEYLKKYPDAMVVVTGGQGYGETISEAAAMKNYLVGVGIGKNRILEEDKATSTFENFKYSKDILKRKFGNENYTIMIITSDFHMFRAKMLAKRTGFTAYGMPAKTWWGVFPNSCVREYFAVIKSVLIDR